MNKQWHPLFAKLLGIALGKYYEIEPEFPVSDLPRAGDFLVVRRSRDLSPPFTGLWNYLTDVNVIEFKGRTDDASPDDLEKFMAVGTGISYRLNERRWAFEQASLLPSTVSFWYIAPMLGPTFREAALQRVTNWEYQSGGLYTARAWSHPIRFVSARDTVIEEDTVPLWLVEGDPAPRAVGEFVVRSEALLRQFAPLFPRLQPSLWQEVLHMVEFPELLELIDCEAVAKAVSDPRILEHIPPQQFVEAIGAKRVMEVIGAEQAMEVIGAEQAVEAIGVEKTFDALMTQVSVEQLQEMLRRHQQPPPSQDQPS